MKSIPEKAKEQCQYKDRPLDGPDVYLSPPLLVLFGIVIPSWVIHIRIKEFHSIGRWILCKPCRQKTTSDFRDY